jgi:hypothetical protein
LATNHPVCIMCGEDDWRCLERHHVGGKVNDDLTAIHCRNCHRKLSDPPKGRTPDTTALPHKVSQISYVLDGLADFFELLIQKLREYARELREFVREQCGASGGPQP